MVENGEKRSTESSSKINEDECQVKTEKSATLTLKYG